MEPKADPSESSPKRRLQVLPPSDEIVSSMGSDGHRRFVYAASVTGRFATMRRIGFAILFAIFLGLPFIRLGGRPIILLDIAKRQFFLFGLTFNSQDAFLLFFVLTGFVFTLAFATSLYGRVFCGFVCPQTVFLDGLFRPIERLFEGPAETRRRRDNGPWTAPKIARKAGKHLAYLVASFLVAHIFLSFFVPLPETVRMVMGSPGDHPEAFAWALSITLLCYGDFAWFREQLCLVVCPYGRLQGSLVDDDSLVVGYDTKRGEPRGKVKDDDRGSCVDCRRCIAVCPTGIDIRNGLQLDCVGCTACIDACDEIMDKVGQPKGLIRFDSKKGFAGEPTRIMRPRVIIYMVLGLFGIIAASLALFSHKNFEATLVRQKGAPFVVERDQVRNTFTLQVVNKTPVEKEYRIVIEGGDSFESNVPESVTLGPMESKQVSVVLIVPQETFKRREFDVIIEDTAATDKVSIKGQLLGPTP